MTSRHIASQAILSSILSMAFVFGMSKTQAEENLIPDPGFEDGGKTWGIYVSGNSAASGCEFLTVATSPQAGTACAEMKSANNASFSISPQVLAGNQKVAPVKAGERWKLTFWIRSTEDTSTKASPAFFVRIPLLQDWKKLPKVLFIGLNGASAMRETSGSLDIPEIAAELPTKWTKVESVFEIPKNLDANQMGRPEFYARGVMGTIYLDDISLEKVAASTALSQTSNAP